MDAGRALVFLAEFFHQAAGHEILKLLVCTQTEHFLPAAHGIAQFKVCENPLKQVIETKNRFLGENGYKFIGDMIG